MLDNKSIILIFSILSQNQKPPHPNSLKAQIDPSHMAIKIIIQFKIKNFFIIL